MELWTLAATVIAVALVMGLMAAGRVLGGRPLRGSCGGPGAADCDCSAARRATCPRRSRPRG